MNHFSDTCPKCQTMVKEKWLNNRKAELLSCSYFHNVFTLPHELNPLIMINKKIMLALLFTAVQETLQVFARDPQWRIEGQLGFTSVLHTWNQKLMDHYHLHCIIPAGALSFDRKNGSVPEQTGIDICCCPLCGKGKMVYLRPIAESSYEDTS